MKQVALLLTLGAGGCAAELAPQEPISFTLPRPVDSVPSVPSARSPPAIAPNPEYESWVDKARTNYTSKGKRSHP